MQISEFLKKHLSSVHQWMTYALFFVLPFPDKLLPLFLGLWAFTWLMWRVNPSAVVQPLNTNIKRGVLCFAVFVLFNFASSFWGNEFDMAGKIIERRLSLLIVCVALYLGISSKLSISKISKVYLLGSLSSILIFCSQFIYSYFTDGVLKYQVDVVGVETFIASYKHPAYLSLNLVLSLFLYLFVNRKSLKLKVASVLIIDCVFALLIYISGSRAGFLSVAFLNIGILVYVAKNALGTKKTLWIAIPMLLIFAVSITQTDKFMHILDNSQHVDIRAPRKVLWTSAIELVAKQPLFGYGLGESKVQFVENTVADGMSNGVKRQYNCHNQYLETALESGLLSLLLLFIAFVFFYKGVNKEYRTTFVGMMGFMGFAFLFESMLLRIAAITLFVGVLIITTQLSKKETVAQGSTLDKWIAYIPYLGLLLVMTVLLLIHRSTQLAYDPFLPVTYASRNYSVIQCQDSHVVLPEELQGKEIGICKFDSTSTASLWSNNAYMLNRIEAKEISEDQILTFSTYCYVSEDFDGTWVRASIDRKDGSNFGSAYYNLEAKGTWQHLSVEVRDQTGLMPAYHYFSKHNCNSFNDLKGYVLFAYPQYIIEQK